MEERDNKFFFGRVIEEDKDFLKEIREEGKRMEGEKEKLLKRLEEAQKWFADDLSCGKCSDTCLDCRANEVALWAIEKWIKKIKEKGRQD